MRKLVFIYLLLLPLVAAFGQESPLFDKACKAYEEGNYKTAVEYLKYAADLGHAESQNLLGVCYMEGLGVQKDEAEADKWFRASAAQGCAGAQRNIGLGYYNNGEYEKAVEWYRKAADQWDAEAQLYLGLCYLLGKGVAVNYEEADKLLFLSAGQGNAQAQFNLGLGRFNNGNYKEAVEWYRRAAEQGYDSAQLNLAICYLTGKGVEIDYKEADKWLRAAAAQGNVQAFFNLGLGCYNNKNYAEAKTWLQKAAAKGHADAAALLQKIPKE